MNESNKLFLFSVLLLISTDLIFGEDAENVEESLDDAAQVSSKSSSNENELSGFNFLPPDIREKLHAIQEDTTLSFWDKQQRFDELMNTVPPEILAKAPLPPGFEQLPPEFQEQIKSIHTNTSLSWNDKHREIGQLIDTLPPHLRTQLPPRPPNFERNKLDFPPAPPPGFEKVLPPDVYAQLVKIHQDPELSPKEKVKEIDEVMHSLPQEVIDQLPLPPAFNMLPPDVAARAKKIFTNKDLSYEERSRQTIKFIKSLPPDQRNILRPPMPPSLQQLSPELKEQIEATFLDENLNEEERDAKFWQIVDGLPADQRKRVYQELGKSLEKDESDENATPQ